jgi:type II secretory pathway pseudopilin PulG
VIKGKWIIITVFVIAVVMGIATWPLLRIRRRHEIHKTEAILESLRSACEQYRSLQGDTRKISTS